MKKMKVFLWGGVFALLLIPVSIQAQRLNVNYQELDANDKEEVRNSYRDLRVENKVQGNVKSNASVSSLLDNNGDKVSIADNTNNFTWTKANESGFGDAKNYSANSIEFNGYLYVGTYKDDSDEGAEIWRYDGSEWQEIVDGGFNDNNNVEFYLETFGDYLLVSTGNYNYDTYTSTGGEVWLCNINTGCDQESDFSRVISGGFGNIDNEYIYLTTIGDYIFADTFNLTTGFELHRSSDGINWQQIGADGLGTSNNLFINFIYKVDNSIFLSTFNTDDGSQIFKSIDNGESFTQVGSSGFGSVYNIGIYTLREFGEYIYWSTYNDNGLEIWRCPKDASNFERVVNGGFGDVNNYSSYNLREFNGYLYTITNNYGLHDYGTGTELWRTANGLDWEQVEEDGFGNSGENSYSGRIGLMQDYMYITVQGDLTGVEIWRTQDGENFEQINNDGFGNINNIASWFNISSFNNQIYVITVNGINGTEIWRTQSLSPSIPSDFTFSLPQKNTGLISMSFNANDPVDKNDLQAKIEYSKDNSDNWFNLTLTSDVSSTTGTPIVNNNEYQISNISTLSGENMVNFVWNAHEDELENELSAIKIKITLYDGVGESESYISDNNDLRWVPTLNPIILTTSGLGEPTRLQAYSKGTTDGTKSLLENDITDLYPDSYTGGAGIVSIDQNNNTVLDQFLLFAIHQGGPQVLVRGLKADGSLSSLGQMFVFQNPSDKPGTSSIRDGLSAASGDFDNDGYKDDAAFCLTGNYTPHVKIYKDVSGIDNWELINQFTVPNVGATGCNLGTFQYDDAADEILITPNHGPADPNVYIYTVGGTLKKQFQAYPQGIQAGLSATGISDRIYTTPNNGTSQVNAFDKEGVRKNFWWVYDKQVKGDFTIRAAQLDPSTDKEELLISPIGQNGPHILGYRASGIQKPTPNFFAFGDKTLRNGVGIATIENWHGVN